ncbi:MAG: hypothetical protein CMF74_12625 [Maricaulis sp.]|jgi:hypothetical protein|nr:hypothetical protein [Maricaulis sp.]|tara:strand:- start:192 stop:521 length:330 start_codon:yes stop_codon:yes gene_type:complete
MIDTDKYKGHTPIGFWQVVGQGEPEDNGVYSLQIPYWMAFSKVAKGDSRADRNLIQDAPFLLQEVKRLREQYTELREVLIGDSPNWTHEELIEFTIKTLKIALDNIGDD